MERKSFDVKIEEKDGGRISGYASTFDRIPDSYGDVIAKGAFAESLESWRAKGLPIPLLFGHRVDDPHMNIGAVDEAGEDERGLFFEARFDAESETAQYCRKLVKEGRISQFSFAFDVLDEGDAELEDGTKVRELRKLDIYEISLVPIPANPRATVEDVKAAEPESKAGRVLSKSNEDDLREAMSLIEGVLAKLEGDQPAAPGEEEGDASADEAGAKGALLAEQIDKIINRKEL